MVVGLYPAAGSNWVSTPEDAENWQSPTNHGSDNGVETFITASTFDAGDISSRLRAQTFGFTVPSTSTVDGIVVEIERRCFAGAAKDYRVQLISDASTLVGNNKANTALAWPGTATVATYGGITDTWGWSPTPALVNSTNFGVVVSAESTAENTDIGIDFIRITIYTVIYVPLRTMGEVQPGNETGRIGTGRNAARET